MKNIEVLYTPEEITAKINSMWKTDLFRREAQNPDSIIYKALMRGAQYPLFLYDMSDMPSASTPDNEKIEWAHFTSWMGGIARRTYSNDYIADLALLHELYHKGSLSYSADMDHEAFKRKMFDNELEASVTTELEIYLRYPELREHTFKQEIFVDRFLRDEAFMKRWREDPERMRAFLREKRRDAMYHGDKGDTVQYWIQKFSVQNDVWANIWSERFNQVETRKSDVQHRIAMGEDPHTVMNEYMAWLLSPEITEGTEVPFYPEAQAFAGIAALTKRNYNQAVQGGDMPRGSLRHYLAQHHPGQDPYKLFAGPLAEELHGPIPDYSDRNDYQITNVTTTTQGAFVVPYHQSESHGVKRRGLEGVEVTLIIRGDTGPNGEPRYGVPGGYMRLKAKKDDPTSRIGEQPREGATREFSEEVRNADGLPVITFSEDRLNHISEGIDYRKELAVGFNGYALPLTSDELEKLREHSHRMNNDTAYTEAVTKHTNGETRGTIVLPLEEVLKMPKESFTHPHELEAIESLAQQILEQGRSSWAERQ